jgi:tetratricopeptide (TPR) repeat protein
VGAAREPERDETSDLGRAPEGGPYEWWQRATELLERGDAAAASVLLERSVAVTSTASGWEALGRACYDSGRFVRAVEAFDQLVALSPDSHYGHFALGLSLTRVDRFELGVEHLAVASAMRPDRREYADRLRQARATLRARRDADG